MIKKIFIISLFMLLTSAINDHPKDLKFNYSKELLEIKTNLEITNRNLIIADSLSKIKNITHENK